MRRFYLAHPILDREWIRKEELEIEKNTNLNLINPFYDGKERRDIQQIDKGKQHPYGKTLRYKNIVEGDLSEIHQAQGLLGLVTGQLTVGTSMEIFYNSFVLKRPTYLIILKEELFDHPWLKYMATERFHSFEEFKQWWKKNGE